MRLLMHLLPLWILGIGLSAEGQQPITITVPTRSEAVSYSQEIADILDAKCVGCHSSALAENRLNMETVAGMLKGGKRGPALVAGKADDSLLFQMAAHRVEPVMPPKDKKDQSPLTSEELGLLKLWIDAGTKDDSESETEAPLPIELGELPPGIHPVTAVDMTSDGRRLAAGRANRVQVYDADSGLEIITLGGHKDLVQSIRYSPDGRRLAAGSYQIVTVWDAPTGGELRSFSGHGEAVRAVVPMTGGQGFVSASADRTVRFWDVEKEKETGRIASPNAPVTALALSPNGDTIAAGGGDGLVRIWTVADHKEVAVLRGHEGPVEGIAFLSRGERLASASTDGTVRLWALPAKEAEARETPADAVLVLKGHEGPVHAVAVSHDGETIATAGEDRTVRLWRSVDGEALRVLKGHEAPVLALAFDPRGGALLTGSADTRARLFDLATGEIRHLFRSHAKPVSAVAFSASGTRLATASQDGAAKLWETDSGQGVIAFGHRGPNDSAAQSVATVAFLDETRIVTGSVDKTLKTWRFEGSWALRNVLGPHVFRVLALDFHPDGNLLAAGGGEPSRSGEVKIWEVPKGFLAGSLDDLHSDTVFGLRFRPDGLFLASCAADKFLKVVKVSDTRQVQSFEGHTHHVMGVDWNGDGSQLVTAAADNVLKVWDARSGEQLRTLQAAAKQVTFVRWVPGKPIVAGASGDHQVRFWNPDNGRIDRTFSGPEDFVFSVAVSSDGKRVAAGGADGVLYLWRGDNGQVMTKIPPLTTSPASAPTGE
jgi:WD40 repeat protein